MLILQLLVGRAYDFQDSYTNLLIVISFEIIAYAEKSATAYLTCPMDQVKNVEKYSVYIALKSICFL
jgi:hypothetical protein